MSTTYGILERERTPVVTVTEHSSLLDLEILGPRLTNDGTGGIIEAVLPDLTPDELVSTALQLLKAASYQYEEYEFQNAVRAVVLDERSTYLREVIVAAYDALPRLD